MSVICLNLGEKGSVEEDDDEREREEREVGQQRLHCRDRRTVEL